MKQKQLIAIAGLVIFGLLIAYGISLLSPQQAEPEGYPEADAELRVMVEKLYKLEPGVAGIYVRKQEGDYYLLELHADRIEGGGGHWSVMKRSKSSVREIEAGQYCAPSCRTMKNALVPPTLIPYCRTNDAIYDDGLIDRATGKAIENPNGYCL